ncbi:hypothetical protein [Streptantibioticus parmotrematis]|nr:hypothetical protein [Streptantibioticus parmotrematis]
MSLFYAVCLTGIFMILGLVVDGGGRLQAGSRADSLAQEAARAGGEQVDPAQAITGTAIAVQPAAAQQAASSYLHQAGVTGEVSVSDSGQTLSVTVHTTYHPVFASLLGFSSMPVTGHATATLLTHAEG